MTNLNENNETSKQELINQMQNKVGYESLSENQELFNHHSTDFSEWTEEEYQNAIVWYECCLGTVQYFIGKDYEEAKKMSSHGAYTSEDEWDDCDLNYVKKLVSLIL
jgi:hypothetical protein